LKAQRRRLRRETGVAIAVDAKDDCRSADPAQVLIWREIRANLDDAVLSLPGPDRQAVLLRYFQEQPIREIALAMRVSEDAVNLSAARLDQTAARVRRCTRDHLPVRVTSCLLKPPIRTSSSISLKTIRTFITKHP
jgi:DNA-directed RNA polymerase specialized sigma24 family protein